MKLRAFTRRTPEGIRAMKPEVYQKLYDRLEDENMHTACGMIEAARANKPEILKFLEALDDLHVYIGHAPDGMSQLRRALSKLCTGPSAEQGA